MNRQNQNPEDILRKESGILDFFCSKNFFFLTEIPKKPSRKENERIKKDNGSRADAGGRHTNKSGETRRHKEIRKESQKENVEYSFLFFFFFNHRPLLLQADNPQRRSQRVFFFFFKERRRKMK